MDRNRFSLNTLNGDTIHGIFRRMKMNEAPLTGRGACASGTIGSCLDVLGRFPSLIGYWSSLFGRSISGSLIFLLSVKPSTLYW